MQYLWPCLYGSIGLYIDKAVFWLHGKNMIRTSLLIALLQPITAMAITGIDFNALKYDEKGMYIIGIDDGLSFMGASCTQNGPKTYEETLNVVLEFMQKHPYKWINDMSAIYAEAVINAFDCGNAGTSL